MSTAASSAAPRPAILHDIDWDTYTRLLRAFERQPGFRLTYDEGTLVSVSVARRPLILKMLARRASEEGMNPSPGRRA